MKSSPDLPDNLLDERVIKIDAAAEITGIHVDTLRRYIKRGRGPRTIQLGTRNYGIRIRDLKSWLESRATPTHIPEAVS